MEIRLKIFVDCHVFDGEFQGTRTYIQGLYLELVKNDNIDFYLAAYNIKALQLIFGVKENITYLKYTSKNKAYRLLVDTPLLIKKHKINFAHFQYRVPPIKLCRYINTIHDVLFEDYPQYFPVLNRLQSYYTFKLSAKYSDIVFTVSKYSQERIQAHLGVHSVITPNAVDEVFFERYDKAAVQKEVLEKYSLSNYIIYISRWEPRKNHLLILRAFVNLHLYKSHSLLFIGDETFKSVEYDDYFSSLPPHITAKVTVMRRVDFSTMLLLLRGAEASVYPSLAEGFGIPPLEALAAGIPTVSSKATAMQDYDFLGDYNFDPNDQEDFERAVKLILDFQFEKEFSAIKEIIRERYSWKKAAEAFRASLQDYLVNNSN